MIDDVLDLYGEDKNNEMNDELLEMYLRENEAVDEEPEEERASSDDNRPEHSLKSHGTEKANSSKFTISTKDSQRTGKKGKFYEILRDEGKSYKYEDDPRKYMQIRKYTYFT
jgi:hypothetical protein